MALARRDLSAMYRQSVLGYFWAFLPVVATTAVFLVLRAGGAFSTGDQEIPYPLYLFTGTILWQVFADAVQGPLKVIGSSRAMLVKVNFPRESLILAAILITVFNFFVRLAVLVPALIYFGWKGQFDLHWTAFIGFPLGVLSIILLGYSIGILLTPAGLLYKDVSMGIGIILGFWMFLSPVVVTIPDGGPVRTLMSINPASPVIDCTRAWLVGAPSDLLPAFCVVVPTSALFLWVGWILYRVSLPHVISRLGM